MIQRRGRQMKTEIIFVRYVASQTVDDQPVLAGDKKQATGMDRFVNRTANFAAYHVQVRRGEAFPETRFHERTFWFTAPVRNLVSIVDANCVMRCRALEVVTPSFIVFGV